LIDFSNVNNDDWEEELAIFRMAAISSAAFMLLSSVFAVNAQDTGSEWEKVIEAAKSEGSLTFYTSENPVVNDKLVQAFGEKYDIEVEVLRLATSALTQRYASEAAAGAAVADVIVLSDPSIYLKNPEWFTPLEEGLLPSAADFPEDARHEHYVEMYVHPNGITYNTNMIDEASAPKSWQDLLKPEYEGKILFTDPRTASTYTNQLAFLTGKYGIEFIEGLAAQDLTLADSAAPAAQQVAAGAFAISTFSTPPHAQAMIEKNAPIAHVTPDDTSGVAQTIGISADAQSPNAARLWADFILSKEGAEISCNGITASLRPDAEGCRPLPPGYTPPKWDRPDEEIDQAMSALGLSR
jgi:iron(III) transport system substrate-binding protein